MTRFLGYCSAKKRLFGPGSQCWIRILLNIAGKIHAGRMKKFTGHMPRRTCPLEEVKVMHIRAHVKLLLRSRLVGYMKTSI
jgi:hypothetical protein